jgi:hypothetical protein
MSESRLSYVISHEAHYKSVIKGREINVQREALTENGHHDGVHWEFHFQWHDFGDHGDAVQVKLFDDAWQAFTEVPELFAALSARHTGPEGTVSMPPAAVAALLDEHGFTDITERERP